MTPFTRGLRVQLIALVACLAVAACQNAPVATPTPGPVGTPGASAPPPSTAPSPSQVAVDVVPLFVEAMKGFDSGIVNMDGSATVGPVKVTISGSQAFDGPDNKGKITTTVAGVSTVAETVLVAGKAFTKQGDGPWLAAPTPTSKDLTGALKDTAAGSFTDKGTINRKGTTVHQLEAGSGSAFDPSVFLSSASGVTDVAGTTTFYCKDDGTPVGATIDLTWKQAAGAATLDASMTFEIDFASLGSPQSITAPAEVWKRFNAAKRGYSIGYPPNYDHTARNGFDYFFGPSDQFFFSSRTATQGYTLNIIAKGETSSIKSELKAKSVTNEDVVVGGVPGRLLKASGSSADLGGKVVFYEAIVVKGKFAYFIAWVSKQGNEEADLATFKQVLASFQFTA